MILDGNQRGGARDLAQHLMKQENEHIEVHEIRGFVADTVMGALREAEAISRGTRCAQHLYSLSLSPPETENVSIAVFEAAVERIEAKLDLVGHARVVVFHEKNGRRHAHCVWSRINPDTMTAVRMSHDRRKLGDMSRELYLENGWKMPEGLIDPELRNPLNFDRKEWFQAKRAGKDPRTIKSTIMQCWAASDSGKAFRHALEARGYYLAQGDRGGVVAIDTGGEIYAVARWLDLRTKEVRARMSDVAALPPVAETQRRVAGLVQEKISGFVKNIADEFARVTETLEGRRLVMVERHRVARRELTTMQKERGTAETCKRAERFRKGLLGLWDRVTGQHARLRAQNERESASCAERDAHEKQKLINQQLIERRRLQQEIREERAAHSNEMTRLYQEMSSHDITDNTPPEERRRARRRERSGPT